MADEIKSITVEITDLEMISQKVDYNGEMYAMRIMRAAGIPVSGIFAFRGVERGTLYVEYPRDFSGIRIRWRDSA